MYKRLLPFLIAVLIAAPGLAGDRYPEAVTLWGVFFNNPGACSDGACSEDDIFDDPTPAQTSVVFLTGQRTALSGHASFAAAYPEGPAFQALPFPGGGLWDAATSEVHLVVRTHGRYRRWLAAEQLTTFGGGCEIDTCEDLQFAIFKAEEADAEGKQTTQVFRIADGSPVPGSFATLWREGDGIRAALHTRLRQPAGDLAMPSPDDE